MNLRDGWVRRLESALSVMVALEPDFSWRAQLDARITCFLLKRYGGDAPAAPLGEFPMFQGQAPHGRTRAPLSPAQQHRRLDRIAQAKLESSPDASPLLGFKWQRDFEEAMQRQAKSQAQLLEMANAQRERYRTRRERGYW